MTKINMTVLMSVNSDIEALWREIGANKEVHLGGKNGQYSLTFIGDSATGLEVLGKCLEYSSVGKYYADYIDT